MKYDRITHMAKKITEFDMIQAHTQLPEFPELRTSLLYAFLCSGLGASKDQSELYALAASLAQMSMDTHDLVDTAPGELELRQMRSRQLRVLAGDYFSSRFYHLLSQAGQINMIKYISNAICEVNRLKMNLYVKMQQLKLSAEDYFIGTVDIKMQLYLCFADVLEGPCAQHWPGVLRAFTRCEVLLNELQRIESHSLILHSWGYWRIVQSGSAEDREWLELQEKDVRRLEFILHKYNIRSQLTQMLDDYLQQLIAAIEQFDFEPLKHELIQMVRPFIRKTGMPLVLEEI